MANTIDRVERYYCEGPCGERDTDEKPVYRIEKGYGTYFRCADCAYEGLQGSAHDDCISTDDGHYYDDCDSGSCSNCGDPASYCDASCAIADGSTVYCSECGEDVHAPNTCNECKADSDCDECRNTSTGTPALVGAASTVTNPENVDDDGNVSVEGIEFRFD